MSDTSKQSLAVLQQVAEFLEGLPEDQLDDLADGRARLTLIPWGSAAPLVPAKRAASRAKPASTVDAEAIAAQVEAAPSREAAEAILGPLKLADLKVVAAALHVPGPAGTKAPLLKQIVNLAAGARLSGDALRAL